MGLILKTLASLASPKRAMLIKAVLAVVSILAIFGFGSYKDTKGYDRASVEYQLKIEQIKSEQLILAAAERNRQQAANDSAKRREATLIDEINTSSDELDQKLLELSVESLKDPDANRAGLNAASVRRINKIQ